MSGQPIPCSDQTVYPKRSKKGELQDRFSADRRTLLKSAAAGAALIAAGVTLGLVDFLYTMATIG